MKKPEPVAKQTVCSLCGLDWESHGEKPDVEKCIQLLKAELARRPRWNSLQAGGSFYPVSGGFTS